MFFLLVFVIKYYLEGVRRPPEDPGWQSEGHIHHEDKWQVYCTKSTTKCKKHNKMQKTQQNAKIQNNSTITNNNILKPLTNWRKEKLNPYWVFVCFRKYSLTAPSQEAMRIWVDVLFTGAEGYQEFQDLDWAQSGTALSEGPSQGCPQFQSLHRAISCPVFTHLKRQF